MGTAARLIGVRASCRAAIARSGCAAGDLAQSWAGRPGGYRLGDRQASRGSIAVTAITIICILLRFRRRHQTSDTGIVVTGPNAADSGAHGALMRSHGRRRGRRCGAGAVAAERLGLVGLRPRATAHPSPHRSPPAMMSRGPGAGNTQLSGVNM